MRLVFAIAVASALGSSAAMAEDGLYLRLDTGWSFSRDAGQDFDGDAGSSPIIGGGIGYRFNDHVRGDFTVSYRGGYDVNSQQMISVFPADIDADVSALTGMVNVYVDVAKFGMFTPYVGGGIGFSRNKISDAKASLGSGVTADLEGDTKTSFAWQLSAGTSVDVAPNWAIDVGYRYIDLGSVKTGTEVSALGSTGSVDALKGDLRAHEVNVGIRYQF